MATFRQLPSGKWQAQIRRRGAPPVTKSFPTKTAASAWARQVENQIDEGRFRDYRRAESTTVAEACDYFTREFVERAAWPETVRPRVATIRRLAGHYTLAQVQARHVVAYVDQRLEDVSADAVLRELSIWSRIITTARTMMQIPMASNPVRDARDMLSLTRTLKPGRARERRVSDDEIDALCRKSRSPILPTLIRFVAQGCTAMRRGELVAAQRSHIVSGGQYLHIPETKTGAARTIPLCIVNDVPLQIIARLPARLDGSLFGITAYAVSQAFARAAQRAGIADITFHDLRHEATSRLFEAGWQIPQVAAITGHQDWRQLRRYTHLSPHALPDPGTAQRR